MLKTFAKKWAFLGLVALSSLIIGLRTAINPFYLFFWFIVCISVFSLSWILLEYWGANLQFSRKLPGRLTEEERLEIEMRITNRGLIPAVFCVFSDYLPCALGAEREKKALINYISSSAAATLRYGCVCPVRDRYYLGPVTVYFFDPFGIFFLKRRYEVSSEVFVYPKTFDIREFPPMSKGVLPWFGISSSRSSGDEDEFFGTREYKYGDPIKRIHWVSTARKSKLIVKQYQNQSYFRATVIFNLHKDKNYGEGRDSIVEYTIKIAASICKYLTEKNISVEVIAHAGELVHIPFNKGHEHLEDILKFLTIARAESMVGLTEVFHEFARYISNDTSLIVISSDEEWGYLPAALPFDKRNISLLPMVLLSSTFLHRGREADKQKLAVHAKVQMAHLLNLNPLFFSCGENPQESFTRVVK